MLNQTVLVGRIVSDPEINETKNDKKVTIVPLAVQRSYKNEEGEYATDFIPCVLWQGIAENVVNYCTKGDLVGIKGRVQAREYTTEDAHHSVMELVAEKVTFLSTKKDKNDK